LTDSDLWQPASSPSAPASKAVSLPVAMRSLLPSRALSRQRTPAAPRADERAARPRRAPAGMGTIYTFAVSVILAISAWRKPISSGLATATDEYVPKITPTSRAKLNA